jgi:hypothetical protein
LAVTGRPPAGEPRLLVLAGRTWLVTGIDWRRRTINVINQAALDGLKLSATLPVGLASRTLAERGTDWHHAADACRAPLVIN